jgi:hypothetical protein
MNLEKGFCKKLSSEKRRSFIELEMSKTRENTSQREIYCPQLKDHVETKECENGCNWWDSDRQRCDCSGGHSIYVGKVRLNKLPNLMFRKTSRGGKRYRQEMERIDPGYLPMSQEHVGFPEPDLARNEAAMTQLEEATVENVTEEAMHQSEFLQAKQEMVVEAVDEEIELQVPSENVQELAVAVEHGIGNPSLGSDFEIVPGEAPDEISYDASSIDMAKEFDLFTEPLEPIEEDIGFEALDMTFPGGLP